MIDALKKSVERILSGLNFFDFSFFISGFLTFFSLLYFTELEFDVSFRYSSVYGIAAAIVLIYICGIFSFSFGKFLRTLIRFAGEKITCPCLSWFHVKSFDEVYKEAIEWVIENKQMSKADVTVKDLKGQLSLEKSKGMIYSAMWIEIRKKDVDDAYYRPLYRQWVLQAICEGLMASFLLIAVMSIWMINEKTQVGMYKTSLIFSIIGFIACAREGRRCAENQIKEVVISYFLLNQ